MSTLTQSILEPQNTLKAKASAVKIVSMLFLRIVLFFCLQLVISAILSISGVDGAFAQSAAWWPFVVAATNLICGAVLYVLMKSEGCNYFDFFRFKKDTLGKDLLWALLFIVIAGPIAMLPNIILGNALFGSYVTASSMLFLPLPQWAAYTQLVIFPLTMALGELPVYFGYVMPRMEAKLKSKALAILVPALLLSAQHLAMPFVLDGRFVLWRAFMFLPFAIYIGIVIRFKPRLLPFILIGHVLIDFSTAILVLTGI